jgi:hypothetical protein
MIPEFKTIKKRSQNLKERPGRYFEDADEYIELEKYFSCESFLDFATHVLDMILYPIYVFVNLLLLEFSPSYIFGLMKTYESWMNFIRREELRDEMREWRMIVKSVGGPWISTNYREFHPYVYADGMVRINMALKNL